MPPKTTAPRRSGTTRQTPRPGVRGGAPPQRPVLVPRSSKVPAQDSQFLTGAQGERLSHTKQPLPALRKKATPAQLETLGARIEHNKQRVG
jgi:hypothetical protein